VHNFVSPECPDYVIVKSKDAQMLLPLPLPPAAAVMENAYGSLMSEVSCDLLMNVLMKVTTSMQPMLNALVIATQLDRFQDAEFRHDVSKMRAWKLFHDESFRKASLHKIL
jgi:hypothetical protein